MKNNLLLVFATLIAGFVYGQTHDVVITGSKKINKKATPQQIIDSLKTRFPDATAIQYYQAPASGVTKGGWAVTEEDNLPEDGSLDYYTISFKRSNSQYYGLYSKDGTLLQSKMEQKLDDLPEPIRNSLMNLSQSYPGYKVKSKNYFKKTNYSKSKEYYEVTASNGKETKKLYYAADGTILKVK